jgi:hypothetical protein
MNSGLPTPGAKAPGYLGTKPAEAGSNAHCGFIIQSPRVLGVQMWLNAAASDS